MSATESKPEQRSRPVVTGVSMQDLLASCAAATAVSTPPRLPDPATVQPSAQHRKAA